MTRSIALASALVVALVFNGETAHAASKPTTKVLVVGIDAGEPDVLGPLIDQGRCPNFARMRAQGSAGKLRSFVPLTRSPVIWASIATGKVPEKHGVRDFFARKNGPDLDRNPGEEDRINPEARPVTSSMWKVQPIWSILSSLCRTVDVVGWWTTWPARRVNGALVSDYVQYNVRWENGGSRLAYPDSLVPMVKALRRTSESVSWAEIFQFVAPFDTTKATDRQKEIVHNLTWIYAADVTFYRVAMKLYRERRPDFFTVYFRGVDEICHAYWDVATGEQYDPPLTKAEQAWVKPMIPNYYVFTDRMLGDLLKLAGKDTDVIVCSDHGFGGGGMGVMAHKPDGIIFMMGPHVVKGGTITGANVLDITPSILAFYGLPTARDMDGRPIPGGIDPKLVRRLERETRLPTYETARSPAPAGEPESSPADDELRERLRSLGYIH